MAVSAAQIARRTAVGTVFANFISTPCVVTTRLVVVPAKVTPSPSDPG